MQVAIYIAAVAGWLGVYMMLPREQWRLGKVGALLGFAALIGFFVAAMQILGPDAGAGDGGQPGLYFYIFSVLAVVCAARVITHPRPVYSALYFVMVVLASAGLFLLLQAEFMAFAMIIIYAGAILVTYLFVIMLASQPQGEEESGPFYDRVAREPFAGSVIGLALVAVLTSVFFGGVGQMDRMYPGSLGQTPAAAVTLMRDMPGKAEDVLNAHLRGPDAGERELAAGEQVRIEAADVGANQYAVVDKANKLIERRTVTPGEAALLAAALTNIDQVGLNLFQSHTLGIELAAIILLLSMVGAVVIAKKRVEPETAEGDVTGPERPTRVETTREPSPTDDRSMGLGTGAASETS